jgi:hypothetical protein
VSRREWLVEQLDAGAETPSITRLEGSRWRGGRRGELFKRLPVGYVPDGLGHVVVHPDQRLRDAVQLVFTKFRELWSVRQSFH